MAGGVNERQQNAKANYFQAFGSLHRAQFLPDNAWKACICLPPRGRFFYDKRAEGSPKGDHR